MVKKSQNYSQRLKQLQDRLKGWRVDGCLIENPIDIFYLTGLQLSLGSIIVTEAESRLFVDGRYFQMAKERSPISVASLDDKELSAFLKKTHVNHLGFDTLFTNVDRFSKLEKMSPLVGICNPLKEIRAIKDLDEQKWLKKSAALLQKGFKHIVKKLKTGITEKELALEFEMFCRKEGAEKLAFDSIIAFGKNSAMPHYHPGNVKLAPGDIVLIDIGVVVNEYHSDMTRVVFWKKPDPELERLLKIVKKSQKAAVDACAPGVTLGELDQKTRAVMREEGMEEYFVHSLGHGVGLEIHEYPRVGSKTADKDVTLQPGMVITIEPGLYLPGKGGARYEDMVLITETGAKRLTTC